LEKGRVLVHVDADNRPFAHANAGPAVPGDEAAEELEEVGIVANEKYVLAVGVLVDELLEIGVGCGEVKGRADFDFAFIAEFVADELSCLKGALQRAGDNYVGLDPEGAEEPTHKHALLFAFGDEAAFGVKLGAFTRNTGVRMTHEVEVHWGMGSRRQDTPAKGKGSSDLTANSFSVILTRL
jgi:hypothetical protein